MPRNLLFSLFCKCLKMAHLWWALRFLISFAFIYGTGCGRFKWNEKGRSPIVLVFGPGRGSGPCYVFPNNPEVFISPLLALSPTLPCDTFLFKFFYEFTYAGCPFIIVDFEASRWSLLLSLKNGEPLLRSEVIAPPLAETPVLLPDDPKGF